jgi:hypothetical protein
VAPLRALPPDFAALLAMPTDAATTTRIERAPTIGRRWEARNGSRCSRAGSAALWHPASPPKAASGAGHRAASAAAVKYWVNCHRNPTGDYMREKAATIERARMDLDQRRGDISSEI